MATDMRLRGDAIAQVTDHGGSLEAAERRFPGARKPWIDLSTGINPHSYPLSQPASSTLARLPEPARIRELEAIAAAAYGAPEPANVVAAPGTQILLPMISGLVAPGNACVLGPTYAEHARAAALAGHAVRETDSLDDLEGADLAVVVNPNNPDGRIVSRDALLALAATLRGRGGLLVVDEAFMDVGPADASVAGDVAAGGLVVLRSFGKFHGLAGLRLGFALSDPAITKRLRDLLGPWAVSGPALEAGCTALADDNWRAEMRRRLAGEAPRLDGTLAAAGLAVEGGTDLFRLVRTAHAAEIFEALGHAGILVRRFAARPDRLRFGLPEDDDGFVRLGEALSGFMTAPARSPEEQAR